MCLQGSEPVYTAFIKHLKESVDEAALHRLFESCGDIKSLKIGREPETNRSRVSYNQQSSLTDCSFFCMPILRLEIMRSQLPAA